MPSRDVKRAKAAEVMVQKRKQLQADTVAEVAAHRASLAAPQAALKAQQAARDKQQAARDMQQAAREERVSKNLPFCDCKDPCNGCVCQRHNEPCTRACQCYLLFVGSCGNRLEDINWEMRVAETTYKQVLKVTHYACCHSSKCPFCPEAQLC